MFLLGQSRHTGIFFRVGAVGKFDCRSTSFDPTESGTFPLVSGSWCNDSAGFSYIEDFAGSLSVIRT